MLTLVKVVRDTVTDLTVPPTPPVPPLPVPLCPPRRSTGFFPGGDGAIPGVRPGPLPGTWIGPTLIFPGVLNPGVPTTIPPTNQILTTAPSLVQVTPAVTPPVTVTPATAATDVVGGTVIT